jgi:uncharacterized membrane protein YphA (DoxX/SURF4 family)
MASKANKNLKNVNIALLGLLMLVPGLLKLFDTGVNNLASGLMANNPLFAWAPMFWAVVLVVAEIGSGVAVLTRWKLKYTAYVPVIILAVATLTTTINWSAIGQTQWSSVFFHLIAIANYLMLAHKK